MVFLRNIMQWQKDNFVVSDDLKLLDEKFFIDSLHTTYWAEKRQDSVMVKSIANSTVFSLFSNARQIGFVRVISDFATYSYICDFFILQEFRHLGLGSWLMECIFKHPVADVAMITLATNDAHNFYRKFGFTQNANIAKKFMIKRKDSGSLDVCFARCNGNWKQLRSFLMKLFQ